MCTKPFPSMPVYFWNDEENVKYKNAYFAKYKSRSLSSIPLGSTKQYFELFANGYESI